MAWQDESHLLAYCRVPKDGDRYVLFDDRDVDNYSIIGASAFDSDGHPSFAAGGRWFVTDSYPDRFRVSRLMIYDCASQKRYVLARLRSTRRFASLSPYKHWACDLHPRWNRHKTAVCFDSAHTGERALCTMDLGKDVEGDCVKNLS